MTAVPMPTGVRISRYMFIVSIAAGPIASATLDPRSAPTLPDKALPLLIMIGVVFLLPLLIFFALVAYKTYVGRNWARYVLLAIILIGVYATAKQIAADFAAYPVLSVAKVAECGLALASVALLFLPSSSAWFKSNASQGVAT